MHLSLSQDVRKSSNLLKKLNACMKTETVVAQKSLYNPDKFLPKVVRISENPDSLNCNNPHISLIHYTCTFAIIIFHYLMPLQSGFLVFFFCHSFSHRRSDIFSYFIYIGTNHCLI